MITADNGGQSLIPRDEGFQETMRMTKHNRHHRITMGGSRNANLSTVETLRYKQYIHKYINIWDRFGFLCCRLKQC